MLRSVTSPTSFALMSLGGELALRRGVSGSTNRKVEIYSALPPRKFAFVFSQRVGRISGGRFGINFTCRSAVQRRFENV